MFWHIHVIAVFFYCQVVCMKRTDYCGIDAVKLLCALLIVCIHTEPFSAVNGTLNSLVVNGVCRVAVPFFFVSSAFLFFDRTAPTLPSRAAFSRYIVRLLTLYGIWSAVYFPFTVAEMVRSGSVGGALSVFGVWLKNMFFSAGYGFLWYLPASIVAMCLVYFLRKRGVPLRVLLTVAFLLYGVGLLGQSYFGLLRPLTQCPPLWTALRAVGRVIGTTRNGVFEGMAFAAIGCAASAAKLPTVRRALVGFLLSLLLLICESALLGRLGWKRGYDMYLSLLPCAYFLLQTARCIPPFSERIAVHMRQYSTLIYFLHMLPVALVSTLPLHSLVGSALVLALTLAASTAVLHLSGTRRFAFLKTIY